MHTCEARGHQCARTHEDVIGEKFALRHIPSPTSAARPCQSCLSVACAPRISDAVSRGGRTRQTGVRATMTVGTHFRAEESGDRRAGRVLCEPAPPAPRVVAVAVSRLSGHGGNATGIFFHA